MQRTFFVALLSMSCLAVSAQVKKKYTNFNDTVIKIDEVVVQGTKKHMPQVLKLEVPKNYLPMAQQTLSTEVLNIRGIQDIQSAVRFLPNVRMQTSYGAFQQLSIRGFDYSMIMVDGVRDERTHFNSYPFMDLSSVESIELLKGPASVLYGQAMVGGVINISRYQPTAEKTVRARVAYGSWQNTQAGLNIGGKLAGPFNYRASVNFSQTDGWRKNAIKRLSGYLAIAGDLSKRDQMDFRISGHRDSYATEMGLPDVMPDTIYKTADNTRYLNTGDMLPNLDRAARYNSESDFMYNRNFNVAITHKHTFNDALKWTNKLSYTHDDIDYFSTEDMVYPTSETQVYDYYYMSKGKKKYIALDSIKYDFPLRFSHIAKTFNAMSELNGHFYTGPIKHNYIGGYSYIYLHRDTYTGYNIGDDVYGPGVTGTGTSYHPHSIGWMGTRFSKVTPQRTDMHGVYFHDLMEVSEQWKVLIAGRFDFHKYRTVRNLDVNHRAREYDYPGKEAFAQVKTSAFSTRVGVVYLPTKDWSIFGSFGTYFRPITTFANANTIYLNKDGKEFTPNEGGEVFKPEKGMQLELGTRYELTDKLRADVSLFYINKYNIVRSLANKGSNVNGTVLDKNVVGQVGKMDSKGFEVELTYQPIASLSLTAGYGFTDARVRKIAGNAYLAADALEGKYFSNIPKNTAYVYGNYEVERGVLKGLGVNFSFNYFDKVYRNNTNTTAFPSYCITDLGCSYRLNNGVRLGVQVNNVFNKKYFNQALGTQYVPSAPCNLLFSAVYSL